MFNIRVFNVERAFVPVIRDFSVADVAQIFLAAQWYIGTVCHPEYSFNRRFSDIFKFENISSASIFLGDKI